MIKDLDSLNRNLENFGNGTKSIVDELTKSYRIARNFYGRKLLRLCYFV